MEEVSQQDVMSNNNDRISDLHDSIIMHILSFLTAKEAVHTCLLSKRWRDLWAYLPCLNLDFEEFDSEQLFERFVFSLLLLRKIPYIDTFRLKLVYADACGDPEDVKASNTWIHHVLRSKPRVISFNCGVYDPLDLPTSFFCCHSLEDVTLMLFYDPDIRPGIINLPRLKRLKFGYISIRDQLMQNVISGCPMLEELELVNCPLYVSNISSSMLKCLSILDLSIVDCKNGREITIDTPNLESLRLVGEFVNGFKLRNMQSLVSAFLSVSKCCSFGCEILSGLSNVRRLELFGFALKYLLIVELQECPTFVNLKQLTLDEFFKDAEFDMKSIFLEHSPNLREILFSKSEVKNVCDSDSDNDDDSEEYDDSDDNDGDDDDDTDDDEDDDDGDDDDTDDGEDDDDGDDAM